MSASKVNTYCVILALGTLLFGWNIAELNAPEAAIRKGLSLNDAQIGLASSIFAIGGLVGALLASPFVNFLGRRYSVLGAAIAFLLGGALKASAMHIAVLVVGRFISGLGAGCSAVVIPLYINELAPPSSKGKYGALTQVSINVGILATQILGIFCDKPTVWRLVLLAGGAIGGLQAILIFAVPESPAFIFLKGDKERARKELIKLRHDSNVDEELASYGSDSASEEEQPLLDSPSKTVGILEFATAARFRSSFFLVVTIMLAQQFLGINAVVMYGVAILRDLLPGYAGILNASISGVNLIITIGASTFFDKVAHKVLLMASMFGMTVFSLLLALGIKFSIPALSAVATFCFVSSFSVGLGPLPWMVAAKNVDTHAVGSAQSLALVANWSGTFVISFGVPVVAALVGMDGLFFGFFSLGLLFLAWGYVALP